MKKILKLYSGEKKMEKKVAHKCQNSYKTRNKNTSCKYCERTCDIGKCSLHREIESWAVSDSS